MKLPPRHDLGHATPVISLNNLRKRVAPQAALGLALSLGLSACGDKGEAPKKEAPEAPQAASAGQQTPTAGQKKPGRSIPVRRTLETWAPLSDDVWRAGVYARGVTVDFGTPDQFKYTRGGWSRLWGDLAADDQGVSYAAPKAGASLKTPSPLPAAVAQIQIRARGAEGGKITLRGRKEVLLQGDLTGEWQVLTAAVPAEALPAGEAAEIIVQATAGAQLDWLWLGAEGEAAPPLPPRLVPLRLGERTRRALPTPTPRAYTFYTVAPQKGRLVVDYGAKQPTTFTARITDGVKTVEVTEETGDGAWHPWALPMDDFAGQAVEITLSTTKGEGVAGFGEPEIMVPVGVLPEGFVMETPARKGLVVQLQGEGAPKAVKAIASEAVIWPRLLSGAPAGAAAQWASLNGAYGEGWAELTPGGNPDAPSALEAHLQKNQITARRFYDAKEAAEWLSGQSNPSVAFLSVASPAAPVPATALTDLITGLGKSAADTAVIAFAGPQDYNVGAPVAVRYPAGALPKGRTQAEPVDVVDLAPTLLDLMGQAPLKGAHGQSLLAWIDDRPVSRPGYAFTGAGPQRGVVVGPWRCAAEGPGFSMTAVSVTPNEAGRRPIALALCETLLAEAIARPEKGGRQGLEGGGASAGGEGQMDPELKKQLEALGYFGDD